MAGPCPTRFAHPPTLASIQGHCSVLSSPGLCSVPTMSAHWSPLLSQHPRSQGSCPNWSLQERRFHFAWGHRESVICRTHIPEGVGRKLHGVGSPVPQFDAAGLPQGAAAILSQGSSELASRKGCCIPGPGSASPPASLRAGTGCMEGWNESTPPRGLG